MSNTETERLCSREIYRLAKEKGIEFETVGNQFDTSEEEYDAALAVELSILKQL